MSQLRKALANGPQGNGAGILATHGRGYVLRVEPGQLDRERFERLVAQGQAALDRGLPGEASQHLEGALGLWRGPPLADFTYEPFAQLEIARLEEMRLTALESRIEADLELGRHAAAIAELEPLVAQHPLRERLRGLLMLALYRTGRQAEALDAYREARQALVDELGIEPSTQLQALQAGILAHDPSLGAPRRSSPRARQRRQPAGLIAGALVVLAAAVVAILLLGRESSGKSRISITADSVAAIDPGSGKVVRALAQPGIDRIAASGGAVWLETDGPRAVSSLDRTGDAMSQTVGVGAFPSDIALGGGALWVIDGTSGELVKVDPRYGQVLGRTRFRSRHAPAHSYPNRLHPDPASVAAGAGGVWITDGSRRLVEVDPATVTVVKRIDLRHALNGVAAGPRAVWAISGESATVFRLDPSSGAVTARIQLVARPNQDSPFPDGIALGAGFAWVLDGNTADVTKIDPRNARVLATIPLGIPHGPAQLAAGAGAAWTANADGTVSRIEAGSDTVSSIELPRGDGISVTDVAVGDRWVWLGVSSSFVPGPKGG
ncbi:MAG: BTAD domain-containing putative transcriptional regulator [Thermoleophilaceae bacterium]